jgi:hypothetical protein
VGIDYIPLFKQAADRLRADLKNATDDALAPYLSSLPKPYTFKQSHSLTNIRLALGYTAVIIAAVTFYADWKLGWDATKGYTTVACVVYFILNTLLTYHIWRVEAGRVFVGLQEGGQKASFRVLLNRTGTSLCVRLLITSADERYPSAVDFAILCPET